MHYFLTRYCALFGGIVLCIMFTLLLNNIADALHARGRAFTSLPWAAGMVTKGMVTKGERHYLTALGVRPHQHGN